MRISVIIPTFNLKNRGWDRVKNMVHSLELQTHPCEVIVVDGSVWSQHQHILNLLKGTTARVIHYPNMEVFNKPKLVNFGCKVAKGNYLLCTDADYLYSPDMLSVIASNVHPNTYLLHKVRMLRRMAITPELIKAWDFPPSPLNPYGNLADGGCQVFHWDWFDECGGYDERMEGWCGMDNDMTNRARNAGMVVKWIEEGEILHQFHPVEKGKKKSDKLRMEANWKIRDTDKSIKRNS